MARWNPSRVDVYSDMVTVVNIGRGGLNER